MFEVTRYTKKEILNKTQYISAYKAILRSTMMALLAERFV